MRKATCTERRPLALARAFALLAGLLASGDANAQMQGRAEAVFFDGTVGAGVARIDSEGVGTTPMLGATWRVGVGWSPSAVVALGFSFATWQRNAVGTPIHLHALGPCVELTPSGRSLYGSSTRDHGTCHTGRSS
jgi:hypothetical protein